VPNWSVAAEAATGRTLTDGRARTLTDGNHENDEHVSLEVRFLSANEAR
jgi:hypothetical protein